MPTTIQNAQAPMAVVLIDPATGLPAAPAVTGANTFSGDQTITSTLPRLLFNESDQASNEKVWDFNSTTKVFSFRTRTDADAAGKDILSVTRGTGTAITALTFGNATDNPSFTFLGTATPGHGATTLLRTTVALTNGAAAQTATMTNGPTAGNPTKWVPINDNGTNRYIPAW